MSQNQLILDHLNAGRSLTPLEALNLFGCFRLSARIYDLRAAGHDVAGRMVKTETGKMVAEYSIHDKEKE